MAHYVVGIDRGTTQIKAALIDERGCITKVVCLPSPPNIAEKPGYFEQDMDAIFNETAKAVRRLFDDTHRPEEVLAVGIAGQGNGIFLLDRQNRPLMNAIMPIDERAAEIARAAKASGLAAALRESNGFGLPACCPLALLRWLKEQHREIYDNIGTVLFCKDWLRYRLTGCLGTDKTDPSGAGLFDLAKGEYGEELFQQLDIAEMFTALPPAHESSEIAGYVTKEAAALTGLTEGTPVVYGAHDIAAGSLGTGGLQEGDVTLVAGTMGVCLGVLDKPRMVGAYGTTLNGIVAGKWLTHYSTRSFGPTLQWFIELLCTRELELAKTDGRSVFAHIEETIGSRGPTDVLVRPYLFGSMTASDRGEILNLAPDHRREDVLLGVYQGLAYSFAEALQWYVQELSCKRAYLCGGGANSRLFGQLLADASGIPICASAEKEETCRGAGLCAWLGLDREQGLRIAGQVNTKQVWQPNPEYYDAHQRNMQQIIAINQRVWRK